MAFVVADGVLGLEGIHRWNDVIDINTRSSFPRIEVDSIVGIHGHGDADDNRGARTGRIGEIVYPGQPRGKTVTYTGRVISNTLQSLRTHCNTFRAAFGDRSTEGTMVVRPDAAIGGVKHGYYARVLTLDLDDEQTYGPDAMPSAFQRPFTLSLRQSDPRYYSDWPTVNTGTGADGATITVTNSGKAPTEPWFVIPGPITGTLVVERLTSPARTLNFDDLDIDTGVDLVVDFRTHKAYATDTTDHTAFIVFSSSTWWNEGEVGLLAGANQVRATVAGGSPTITVNFFHANW